jgi:hypothetical protein
MRRYIEKKCSLDTTLSLGLNYDKTKQYACWILSSQHAVTNNKKTNPLTIPYKHTPMLIGPDVQMIAALQVPIVSTLALI